MRDEAWLKGWLDLSASLRDRELTLAMAQTRAVCYRQALDDLTDEQWRYAVGEAIRTLDWFPSAHELREIAAGAPGSAVHGFLPEKTPEQRALEREEARAVYERIRPHLVEVGLVDPARPMSAELSPEEWERRRREQLQRFHETETAHALEAN